MSSYSLGLHCLLLSIYYDLKVVVIKCALLIFFYNGN